MTDQQESTDEDSMNVTSGVFDDSDPDQQMSAPTLGEVLAWLDELSEPLKFQDSHREGKRDAFDLAWQQLRTSLYGTRGDCQTCWNGEMLCAGCERTTEPELCRQEHETCPDCNGQGYRYTGGLVERLIRAAADYDTSNPTGVVLIDALSAEIGPNPEGGEHG